MAEDCNIVNVFIPCQMDMFQPDTAFSVMTVLENLGLHCQYYDGQTCCGRRFYMEGMIEDAKDLGIQVLDNFGSKLPFIIPDSGCAGYMKKYFRELLKNSYPPNELRRFTQQVYELCDYIVNVKHVERLGNTFSHRVFYFKSCSARNLYTPNNAPEILLQNTEGLDLLTDDSLHGCCGVQGRFPLANPEAAEAMTGEIVNRIYSMGAEYVTSTDIHCLQMLDAYKEKHGSGIEVIHIADILKGE